MPPTASAQAARILQFWQAIEIFSPQRIVATDQKMLVVDLRKRDPMPWEPGSHLDGIEPHTGQGSQHGHPGARR